MKRFIPIFLLLAAVLVGGLFWVKRHGSQTQPGPEKPAQEKEEGAKITHDPSGNVILHLPDEAQGEAGITVSKPAAAQFSPEIKAYGRVVDPAPLISLVGELIAARVPAEYSKKELERMKVLRAQNNASERALLAAEQAYVHDLTALNFILAKAPAVWGKKLTERMASFIQPDSQDPKNGQCLTNLLDATSLLVRVDLPAGQAFDLSQIQGARLVSLGENPTLTQAAYFDVAPNIDPQTQGRGLFFLIKDHQAHLFPGAAVTAFVQTSGAPLSGVLIPTEAVVRAEGGAWVYVMSKGSDSFTRTAIALDHPTEKGWFVSQGLKPDDYIVTTGAQTLLSQETKPAGASD